MTTLTADDRALLREVFRAAHAKGWTRHHNDRDFAEPGSRYWSDDRYTVVELDKNGWVKTPISEVESVTVQLAVDVLVAVGVLPVELSSAYAKGRDKVLADQPPQAWRDYSLHQYGEESFDVAVLCRSSCDCEEFEANASGRYFTLGEAVDWAQKHVADHASWDADNSKAGVR